MTTPEGLIKNQVKKMLALRGPDLDQFWPVPNGMGAPALDCIVCYRGYHCEIETKRPGGKPTPRQEQTINRKRAAKSPVFVIDGPQGLAELDGWLQVVSVLPLFFPKDQ